MTRLLDRSARDPPVPISEDCPECGSTDTVTSAFAAANADALAVLSAWCRYCGWGWGASTDTLEAR